MLPKPPVCPHCGNAEIARANLRLAAREKRMREVARLLLVMAKTHRALGEDVLAEGFESLAAKILEGLEAK